MGLTLTQVQTSLGKWVEAYDAVSAGLTVSMNGRTLSRSDAETCWQQITRLQRMENQLLLRQQNGGRGSVSHSLANFESE